MIQRYQMPDIVCLNCTEKKKVIVRDCTVFC